MENNENLNQNINPKANPATNDSMGYEDDVTKVKKKITKRLFVGIAAIPLVFVLIFLVTQPNIAKDKAKNLFYTVRARFLKTDFTGAIVTEEDFSLSPSDQKLSELRDKLPIENQYYRLEFDWQGNKVKAYLKAPHEESKAVLEVWLIDNGYNAIDQEKIELILQ
jgi:hypothetical protein